MSVTDYSPLLAQLATLQERVTLGGNHRYRAFGEYRPGVTTVIKTLDAPRLDDWKVRVQVEGTARAAYTNPPIENEPLEGYVARLKVLGEREKEHERLSDAAKIVGIDVHALVEYELRRMLGENPLSPGVCEEALYRFSGWKKWAEGVGLKPLACEARVFNREHDYAGTIDALVLIEGRPVVLDWKTTDFLWAERRLQSAAYRKALVDMGWPETAGAIVSIDRNGGDIRMVYAEPPGAELDEAFAAFLALLRVYRWQLDLGRRERAERRSA